MQEKLDELLVRMKSGDTEAFEELYRMTSKQVFAYVLTIVKQYQTAEDLTQDTYIKIKKSVGRYQSVNAFGWIIQIAKYTAYNYNRKNSRVTPVDLESQDRKEHSYTESFDGIPVLDIIRTRFDELDGKLLILHLSAGYKHKEVALLLGIPVGTVMWRYSRAINKLRKIIKEEYGE